MDKRLVLFLSEWLNWVDTGTPCNDVFTTDTALCMSLYRYFGMHTHNSTINYSTYMQTRNSLLHTLRSEGMDTLYPFNSGEPEMYHYEYMHGLVHLNAHRLRWVRDKVAQWHQ